MVKPERRTRADLLAAAAIAAVVAAVAALIWWTSDARATISRPAAVPAPSPTPAREVPASLKQLWTAASPPPPQPVVVGGTVVTGDGRRVDGRDPATGESRWSYARDSDLCGVSWVYHFAVAVYRDDRGCGQVSTIDGSTGSRGAARSGYADQHVRLSSDGTTVLSAGRHPPGAVALRHGPDAGLRRDRRPGQTVIAGTALRMHAGVSAAASSSAVSVLEACANQADVRLVLLRPGKEDDEPQQHRWPSPGSGRVRVPGC